MDNNNKDTFNKDTFNHSSSQHSVEGIHLSTDNHLANSDDPAYTLPTADSSYQADSYQAKVSDEINTNGGHLELLEERPVVHKERLDVGKVTVTKHVRTKVIDVPIELVEEYLIVETAYNDAESQDLLTGNFDDKDILRHVEPSLDSKAVVTINGKQVEIGESPLEIVLSRQVATITKDTYAIQEINIEKRIHTHIDSIQVDLQHEELEVIEEGLLQHDNNRDDNGRL